MSTIHPGLATLDIDLSCPVLALGPATSKDHILGGGKIQSWEGDSWKGDF